MAGQNRTVDETSILLRGDFLGSTLSAHLLLAFRRAMAIEHKLPAEILGMQGMSGRKYRYFINNLMAALDSPAYMEVGSWAGSTACAAMYGNTGSVLCIDNWSEFGGPRELFFANTLAARNPQISFRTIESDFREVDFSSIGPFCIYLFDGPHETRDHHDGLVMALPALHRDFVLIVDDWNWSCVREGTISALAEGGVNVHASIEIKTNQYNEVPVVKFEQSEWHNGYLFAYCSKSS